MKPTSINCKTCGQQLVAKDPRKMYCSTKCNSDARKQRFRLDNPFVADTPKNCDNCGATYRPYKKRSRFCSDKCRYDWGNAHRAYPHKCVGCGHDYVAKLARQKYCSASCALTHTQVKRVLECIDCGASFEFIGRTRKERCEPCHKQYWNAYYSAAAIGEGSKLRNQWRGHNPNWRADNPYRRAVRSLPGEVRYKYRNVCYDYWPRCCAVCGGEVRVEVHHIDGDRLNYSLDNLVPLCKTHHSLIHRKPHKAAWSAEEYRIRTFKIWPEGPQLIGIIVQRCATANTANSENAKLGTGLANAELGTQVPSVETVHGAPAKGEDTVQTTK